MTAACAMFYCESVSDYFVCFGIMRLQAARCSGTRRVISSILAILAQSYNIFLLRYTAIYRDFGDTAKDSDEQFFERIKHNSRHILQQYLPERPNLNYSLRSRHITTRHL